MEHSAAPGRGTVMVAPPPLAGSSAPFTLFILGIETFFPSTDPHHAQSLSLQGFNIIQG